jgi:1,4-dihydroxy-2-naphthoate octaprenyltransferase
MSSAGDGAATEQRRSLVGSWRYALSTTNMPPGATDPVTRWLVLTRAAVLPMTLVSAAVAGLLAVRKPGFQAGWFALAAVGLLLAHAGNNLMNDLFDLEAGSDTRDYPRALYAPHPVLSGMITRQGLALAAALVNLADAAILLVLWVARGWPVVAFALAGLVVSMAYTAPPVRLKKRGLGEPSVLLVWGPLMVGGTYFAATGHVSWTVIAASLPYALLATSVLLGKHIDKVPWDGPAGTRTLPVMIGERAARVLTQGMMAGFYVLLVALVATGILPWPALLGLLGVTRLIRVWKAFGKPKPDGPPPELPNYPVWPLWFAAGAFLHARRAGALFVAGLAIAAIFNVS